METAKIIENFETEEKKVPRHYGTYLALLGAYGQLFGATLGIATTQIYVFELSQFQSSFFFLTLPLLLSAMLLGNALQYAIQKSKFSKEKLLPLIFGFETSAVVLLSTPFLYRAYSRPLKYFLFSSFAFLFALSFNYGFLMKSQKDRPISYRLFFTAAALFGLLLLRLKVSYFYISNVAALIGFCALAASHFGERAGKQERTYDLFSSILVCFGMLVGIGAILFCEPLRHAMQFHFFNLRRL